MARKPVDADRLDGPLSRHDVRLDAGSVVLFKLLGEGDLAVGVRRAARMLVDLSHPRGELPREVLARMERTHPDRAAAYYAEHPEQLAEPFRFRPLRAGTTWRATQGLMRQTKYEMLAADPLRCGAPPPDQSADWDTPDEPEGI